MAKQDDREKRLQDRADSRLERLLDLPPTLLTGDPTIELLGNRQMVMEGCRGIMEYDENYIKINGGRYAVSVMGEQLELKNLTDKSCTIVGRIDSSGFGV